IAMINMIGYFGMMSSAFAVVTIQMMLVNGKTREIGVMRAIGAKRKDILIIFIFQGMLIGAIGAGVGTATGLGYTIYAKETKMSFNNSLPLEVTYNVEKIVQTALASFILAIIASLYPSYRATKLLPVEAMRSG
ncbi:MAG: ABC transporter permease, partial [Nitrosopumilus sp.]|nr:ABC transporter permease [Nitrosopumilus sp.]